MRDAISKIPPKKLEKRKMGKALGNIRPTLPDNRKRERSEGNGCGSS